VSSNLNIERICHQVTENLYNVLRLFGKADGEDPRESTFATDTSNDLADKPFEALVPEKQSYLTNINSSSQERSKNNNNKVMQTFQRLQVNVHKLSLANKMQMK